MKTTGLNPIEHLWDVLDQQIQFTEALPHNLQDTFSGLLNQMPKLDQMPPATWILLNTYVHRPSTHFPRLYPKLPMCLYHLLLAVCWPTKVCCGGQEGPVYETQVLWNAQWMCFETASIKGKPTEIIQALKLLWQHSESHQLSATSESSSYRDLRNDRTECKELYCVFSYHSVVYKHWFMEIIQTS